jgi:hypothetical protein
MAFDDGSHETIYVTGGAKINVMKKSQNLQSALPIFKQHQLILLYKP